MWRQLNSKIFGSIHCYHTLDMKKIVEEKMVLLNIWCVVL